MRSSVIYKFQCPGCHASYYGKTSRNLITRCREHLGINKAGLEIKGSSSAIRDHINQSGHAASVNDFSILDRANSDFDLGPVYTIPCSSHIGLGKAIRYENFSCLHDAVFIS